MSDINKTEKICGNCIFFKDKQCFYNPPRVFARPGGAGSDVIESYRPRVKENDFCSKFKVKK